jgi:hypothetical protein
MKYVIMVLFFVPFVVFYLITIVGHLALCLVKWHKPLWPFFYEGWWHYARFTREL